MRRTLVSLFLGLALFCCEGIENSGNDLAKKDAAKEGGQVDGGSDEGGNDGSCESPKPDNSCNTCSCQDGTWACSTRACANDEPCNWTVAESYPEQVTGLCTYDAATASPLVIKLAAKSPNPETFQVEINDVKWEPPFSLNAEKTELSLEVTQVLGTPLKLKITYTAALPGDPNSQACGREREKFSDMRNLIVSQDAACATDSECIAFGQDPSGTCSGPSFTTQANLDKYKTVYDPQLGEVKALCGFTVMECDAYFPSTPQCDLTTNRCIGVMP